MPLSVPILLAASIALQRIIDNVGVDKVLAELAKHPVLNP